MLVLLESTNPASANVIFIIFGEVCYFPAWVNLFLFYQLQASWPNIYKLLCTILKLDYDERWLIVSISNENLNLSILVVHSFYSSLCSLNQLFLWFQSVFNIYQAFKTKPRVILNPKALFKGQFNWEIK